MNDCQSCTTFVDHVFLVDAGMYGDGEVAQIGTWYVLWIGYNL